MLDFNELTEKIASDVASNHVRSCSCYGFDLNKAQKLIKRHMRTIQKRMEYLEDQVVSWRDNYDRKQQFVDTYRNKDKSMNKRIEDLYLYTTSMADISQRRLLNADKIEDLKTDEYWQPILDYIRTELLQIKNME